MATIVFSSGQQVQFDGTPTQTDVEQVATKLGIHQPQATPAAAPTFGDQMMSAASAASPLKAMGSAIKSGFQNLVRAPGDIAAAAKGGADQLKGGLADVGSAKGPVQGLEAGLKAESGLASIISSPLAPLFKPVQQGVNYVADKVSDIPAVQKFAQTDAGKTTARVAGALANAGNIAGTITGVDQVAKALPKAANAVQDATQKLLTPASADSIVLENYNRAIKPSTAGINTTSSLERQNANVVQAVKTIAGYKDNLTFTNEFGEATSGRTPKTPMELANAVDQTKAAVFDQYNALASKAGKAGAKVDSAPIHSQLSDVVNNEALNLTNPSAVQYAKNWQSRLLNGDGTPKQFDAVTAQDAIKNLNSSLDAFYKNPTYDSASHAAIDASIVKILRDQLDASIQNATGDTAYQGLKSQYAALKAIEKDVAKRAVVISRQQGATGAAGLGKYVEAFSAGDMVHGLLSLNPALFAKGVAQSGLTRFLQYMNSPDRAIQGMFSAVEKAAPKSK